MPDTITALATDWIPTLWKHYATLRARHEAELEYIRNVFSDPDLLAGTYIEPDCQRTNPADHHEDEPRRTFRQPIRGWINGFLEGEFLEHDGRHVLFVLSDAGMGKSSLLMMLKLSHLSRFWPTGIDFRLLKLGPETLDEIAAIPKKSKTVLLVDSLDEDTAAWGRIEARLGELLHTTKPFRQVVLTCRTQFFPKGGQTPVESPEKVEVAGFVCTMFYLSPFNDAQVDAYLRKRFPDGMVGRLRKWMTRKENERITRAKQVVEPMQSLRMRPMLLSYIDELMESDLESFGEYPVYEALVEHWLLREERKQEGGPTREVLREACIAVAMYLQAEGKRDLTQAELDELPDRSAADHIRELDVGGRSLLNRKADGSFRFSHYSIQEYLVARQLVTGAAPASPVRATDQVLRFLGSWALEAPDRRVPWEKLDLESLLGIEFVRVPGGEYTLGAEDIGKESKPVHRVRLSPVRISKYPVTNEQYGRFLEANPDHPEPEYWDDEHFNEPRQPVVGVSWLDARAFCRWAGLELPSEAQWEAAARGTDGRRYPWGREKPTAEHAAFDGRSEGTAPVGSYPKGAGPFGTLDQVGNVWEWCRDEWYETAYQGRDGQLDPVVLPRDEGDEAFIRVVRGGSWDSPSGNLGAAIRIGSQARDRGGDLGFRVVCGLGPEP